MKRWIITLVAFAFLLGFLKGCADNDHKIYHQHLKIDRHQSEINAIKRCQDTGGMVILHPILYSFTDCKYPPAVRP